MKGKSLGYLKTRLEALPPESKFGCLSEDEVYLKAGVSLRQQNLGEFAANLKAKPAATCFVLYVNSINGNFGEIVSVTTVTRLNADDKNTSRKRL